MISRITGALVRALLTACVVLAPALLLPGIGQEMTQVVALLALFSALFVFSEYASRAPSLVEFRETPPINRLRFALVALLLLALVLTCLDAHSPTPLTEVLSAVGLFVGHSLAVPFSPFAALLGTLSPEHTAAQAQKLLTAAGLSFLLTSVLLGAFAVLLRAIHWPERARDFNMWVNLPTFDLTAEGPLAWRLKRDAAFNILLGIVFPYLAPPLAAWIARGYDISIFSNDLIFVWTVTLWAFLPASLLMRGFALLRLAQMSALQPTPSAPAQSARVSAP